MTGRQHTAGHLPAPQLLDPDLVAVTAQSEPVPAHPDQRHDLRVVAAEQGGHALFGGGRAGLLTS